MLLLELCVELIFEAIVCFGLDAAARYGLRLALDLSVDSSKFDQAFDIVVVNVVCWVTN